MWGRGGGRVWVRIGVRKIKIRIVWVRVCYTTHKHDGVTSSGLLGLCGSLTSRAAPPQQTTAWQSPTVSIVRIIRVIRMMRIMGMIQRESVIRCD